MKKCTLDEFEKVIQSGKDCYALDVREAAEYRGEFIPGTAHKSLTSIEKGNFQELNKSKEVYLLCMSGNRAARAAERLEAQGFDHVTVVDGGLTAWKQAGKPVQKGDSGVWSLERQVRFAAGLLTALGVAGFFWIHPAMIWLSLFVGCGLMFAAVTNTCGMAMIIARMPWNQQRICQTACSLKKKERL